MPTKDYNKQKETKSEELRKLKEMRKTLLMELGEWELKKNEIVTKIRNNDFNISSIEMEIELLKYAYDGPQESE